MTERAERAKCNPGDIEEECDAKRAMYPESWAVIQALEDVELTRRFDVLANSDSVAWIFGPDDYRDELHRRALDRQTTQLVRLTRWLIGFTLVLIVLTVALVWSEFSH